MEISQKGLNIPLTQEPKSQDGIVDSNARLPALAPLVVVSSEALGVSLSLAYQEPLLTCFSRDCVSSSESPIKDR